MRAVILAVVACSMADIVAAQLATTMQPAVASANLPAQPIGPDDLIATSVYGAPELTRTLRVGPEGDILIPMLRDPVRAAGLLPSELEKKIQAALRREEILVDPVVTVTVVEYRSRPVSVVGAVRKPLTFQAYGVVTLLDALARAEGLSAEAGPEILLSRQQGQAGTGHAFVVQRIPVQELIDSASPALNVRLEGGEEIRVPEMRRVYVVGSVVKPGAYPLREIGDTTVLKLLALSEGLTRFAGKQAFIYRREGGESGKNEIPIEIRKILERKAPDVALEANDILYVPDSKGKRIGLAAIEKILMFGTTAGATALVYGQVR